MASQGGMLILKSSRMYNNLINGLMVGPEASKCILFN